MDIQSRAAPDAATASARIDVGQCLPTVAVQRVGGGEIILPDDVEGDVLGFIEYARRA